MSNEKDIVIKESLGKVYFHRAATAHQDKQFGSAFASFQKAADCSHAEAIYYLANYYFEGAEPVKQNFKKSFELFEKAADLGNADAMYSLANFYYEGKEPVKQDFKKALEIYKRSEKAGNIPSRFKVGLMYYEGNGTVCNYTLALLSFLDHAASVSQPDVSKYVGNIHFNGGFGVEKSYEKALYWFLKSPKDVDCQEKIALIYREGYDGSPPDWEKARLWYTSSAIGGNVNSQYDLGTFYLTGDLGLDKDVTRSIEWFSKAASKQDITSMVCLGTIYLVGTDKAKKNRAKAFAYFNSALKLDENNAQANYYMGELYALDEPPNYEQAIKYYVKSAKSQDSDAAMALGKAFELGLGMALNYNSALNWYTIARKFGNDVAQESIDRVKLLIKPEKIITEENTSKAIEIKESDVEKPPRLTVKIISNKDDSLAKEFEAMKRKLELAETNVEKLKKDIDDKNKEIEAKNKEIEKKDMELDTKTQHIDHLEAEKIQMQKFQMQLVLNMTTQQQDPDKKRKF